MSSPAVHDRAIRATAIALARLQQRFPSDVFTLHGGGVPGVFVPADRLVEVCEFLRDDDGLHFSFLSSVTAIDYLDRFEVVYELRSFDRRVDTSVRVKVGRDEPIVPTVTGVWRAADFQEREVYDLMGIRFAGHPDLRRILLYSDFAGHPLRKDWGLPGEPAEE